MVTIHLTDAKLMAILDGGADGGGDAPAAEHLRICFTCRRRHDVLNRRSDTLSKWFAAEALPEAGVFAEPDGAGGPGRAGGPVSVGGPEGFVRSGAAAGSGGVGSDSAEGGESRAPVMSGTRLGPTLKVAASLILLAAVALSPLGAMIREWSQQGRSGPSRVEAPPAPTTYAFDVAGDDFVIALDATVSGRLVIRVVSVGGGMVAVGGGDGSEEVTLGRARLGLAAGGDGATFDVTIPAGVVPRVIVGGVAVEPEWSPDDGRLPRIWIVQLGH